MPSSVTKTQIEKLPFCEVLLVEIRNWRPNNIQNGSKKNAKSKKLT